MFFYYTEDPDYFSAPLEREFCSCISQVSSQCLPGIKCDSATVFANSLKFLSALKISKKLGNYFISDTFRENLNLDELENNRWQLPVPSLNEKNYYMLFDPVSV